MMIEFYYMIKAIIQNCEIIALRITCMRNILISI